MAKNNIGIAILAAGEGKRLKLDCPKPLAPLCGGVLFDYISDTLESFLEKAKLSNYLATAVIGHKKEMMLDYFKAKTGKLELQTAVQKQQNGTADALSAYFSECPNNYETDYTLVVCADTPLLESEDIFNLYQTAIKNNSDATLASFELSNPYGYGRILKQNNKVVIREEKDASSDEKKVNEVNSGVYIFKTEFLKSNLSKIGSNNASNEFYLTDLFEMATNASAVKFQQGDVFQGVNTLVQLSEVETLMRKKINQKHMLNGVRMLSPESTFIDRNVEIGQGTVIYPNCYITGKTTIGLNCSIGLGSYLKNMKLGDKVEVKTSCHLESSILNNSVAVGPFAHIRPDCELSEGAKIGNFVELKKSKLDKGAKVSHLSYVGDAEIGENTNIGCGFITCNYDGANKHKTIIGKNCFIGSDSQMVAPVTIGDDCYVASGSTITHSMNSGDFAIARARQETKPGLARKFIKKKS
jgi:bifunctional UDP-N-acetylglucosamine pyrophosphorylase/glucosamine-1-phosphate N-acetyltransferase